MERIKQALEQARRDREHADTHELRSPPVRPVGKIASDRSVALRAEDIRTFQPSPDTLRKNRVIFGLPHEPAASAYKMLRTRVLHLMHEHEWRSLAVTSPGPGVGKTLTAINLAFSQARDANHTVVLVDLDLHRPKVHTHLGYEPEQGVADYLRGDVALQDVMFSPGTERLVIIPGRQSVGDMAEMLASPKMRQLVDQLKQDPSRLVFFDLPPLLSVDDALAFSPFVDAVLLVVEEGRTTTDEMSRAMELLRSTNVLGTVLNKSKEATTAPYY